MADPFIDLDDVVRKNIAMLLERCERSQTQLSVYCGHERSWTNKVVKGERDATVGDIPLVAAFFGIKPYQLFQPGLATALDRRAGEDRRRTPDRRLPGVGVDLTPRRPEGAP